MRSDSSGAAREAVPAALLYALLVTEFNRKRDPKCSECKVPLPIFRAPADESSANWHTGVLRWCPFRCHLVLGEVQAALWVRYDLASDPGAN